MEDMWNEITTLSSFHPSLTPNTNPTHHHGFILRDFFTAPSAPENPPSSGEPHPAAPAPASLFLFPTSSAMNPPCGAIAASSAPSLFDSFLKKRVSENKDGTGDRKYKRMMKNRESAARSRARRTAYTYELEKEKNQLIEENQKLRKILQGQQILSAFAAVAIEEKGAPKKRNRFRSLSALF